jgi:hypothetical protein
MSFKKATLAAMLAVSMTSAPVLAQTAPSATSLSVAARSGAEMDDANAVRGGFLIPLIAVLAIIAGIIVAVGGGDGDRPTSP